MPVAPVGAEEVVVGSQRAARPGGNGFLADAQMHEARKAAGRKQVPHPLLERADANHRLQQLGL